MKQTMRLKFLQPNNTHAVRSVTWVNPESSKDDLTQFALMLEKLSQNHIVDIQGIDHSDLNADNITLEDVRQIFDGTFTGEDFPSDPEIQSLFNGLYADTWALLEFDGLSDEEIGFLFNGGNYYGNPL